MVISFVEYRDLIEKHIVKRSKNVMLWLVYNVRIHLECYSVLPNKVEGHLTKVCRESCEINHFCDWRSGNNLDVQVSLLIDVGENSVPNLKPMEVDSVQ